MKYQVDVHLYGSSKGYRELSASKGLSSQDKDVLASTGFGDVSDQTILDSLDKFPTVCGRPLPSGRIAISRCFSGPKDEGGRPTIELRTVVLRLNDWKHLRAGRLENFLNNNSNWDRQKFLSNISVHLTIPEEQETLNVTSEMLAMFISLSNDPRGSYVSSSNKTTDMALFVLLSKLTEDDSKYISWGVRMIGTGLNLSMSTLHLHVKGAGNSRTVNLILPESKTALARDYLNFSGHLPSLGYTPGTVVSNVSKFQPPKKSLPKKRVLIILVWLFIFICVLGVMFWPSSVQDEKEFHDVVVPAKRTYPKGTDPSSKPITKVPNKTGEKDEDTSSVDAQKQISDCNSNTIDDEIELVEDPTKDLDGNGILDECEILLDPTLDCNENDTLDTFEIQTTPALDCDKNGIIDTCEIAQNPMVDMNQNEILDKCDILLMPSLDCNENETLDTFEIQTDQTLDCDHNGVIDSCEIYQDPMVDINKNGILDQCEIKDLPSLDCDSNGVFDSYEIQSDQAKDCNANGQLDICEILDGSQSDCNQNDRPDSCDVADESSYDINQNGIPDECEFELSFNYDEYNSAKSEGVNLDEMNSEFDTVFERYRDLFSRLGSQSYIVKNQQCLVVLKKAIDSWVEIIDHTKEINRLSKTLAGTCAFHDLGSRNCGWTTKINPIIEINSLYFVDQLPYTLRTFQNGIEIIRVSNPNFHSMLDAAKKRKLEYKPVKIRKYLELVQNNFSKLDFSVGRWSKITTRLKDWRDFDSFKEVLTLIQIQCRGILDTVDTLEEEHFAQKVVEINNRLERLIPIMFNIQQDINEYQDKGVELKVFKNQP